MAGYKETFGANVDYAYSRGVTDLTSKVQSGVQQFAGAGKGIAAFANQAKQATSSLVNLSKSMRDIKSEMEGVADPKKLRALTKEFKQAQKAAEHFKKQLIQMPFNKFEAGLGTLTKGLLTMNVNILKMGFSFLTNSIKRVYELQERWTHAIGGFNMKIGGMTKGMSGATKAATQWSSTIRGLTNGSIEEGIQMFGEFTVAMGRTVKAGDKFSKFGVQLARGFGIGGTQAGQISKVFENIGMSADDSAEAMKSSIKAANAADIPVNMLAEDLAKSSTYMARFGKEGQKTLIQGAAWARKYDIALDQLRQSVEGFDMFDEAARSSSKLNTAFGTMINSMDLMMEDDPAKRLEMIRQQMLSQGQTYDKLTPKQRRYFSETLKLSDEQTAALLDANNAGESYADFQVKAEKKQKDELAAKAMMQKMLVKTAQTMYSFGSAFDRVTKAIGRAIHPLLVTLGLASDGEKNFKGFGSVMENITKTVIKFFDSLAQNDKWKSFMKELAKDLLRAGSALKDFVMDGGAANLVGDIAKGMKSFYITVRDLAIKAAPLLRPLLDIFLKMSSYIKELGVGWIALKGFNMMGGVGGISSIVELLGGGKGGGKGGGIMGKIGGLAGGKVGKIGGMLGRGGIAGAVGGIAGGLIGGKGAGIGSALGGVIGTFLGPLGMALGPIVGGFIGKGIEKLFGSKAKEKTQVEKAHEDLAKHAKESAKRVEEYGMIVEAGAERQKAVDAVRKASNTVIDQLAKKAKASKEKEIVLSAGEAKMISARAAELTRFSKGMGSSELMIKSLTEGSKLTRAQLDNLVKGAADYEKVVIGLKDASEKYLKLEEAKLQSSVLGAQKNSLEAQMKYDAADLKLMKADLAKAGGEIKDVTYRGDTMESKDSIMDRFEMAQKYKTDANFRMESNANGGRYASDQADTFDKMKKTDAKAYKQLELSAAVRRREKENAENEKKLITMREVYAKQEAIINMRAQVMTSGLYADFKAANPDISEGDMFKQFLSQKEAELTSLVGGERSYKLMSSDTNFDMPKEKPFASGGVVTRPTRALIGEAGPEAVIPLSRLRENLAGGGSSSGSTMVTQIAEVTLDGQKVGRAIVRSSIRGRN
jgi:hypothetical protein